MFEPQLELSSAKDKPEAEAGLLFEADSAAAPMVRRADWSYRRRRDLSVEDEEGRTEVSEFAQGVKGGETSYEGD